MLAAINGHISTVKYLVESIAIDINAKDIVSVHTCTLSIAYYK